RRPPTTTSRRRPAADTWRRAAAGFARPLPRAAGALVRARARSAPSRSHGMKAMVSSNALGVVIGVLLRGVLREPRRGAYDIAFPAPAGRVVPPRWRGAAFRHGSASPLTSRSALVAQICVAPTIVPALTRPFHRRCLARSLQSEKTNHGRGSADFRPCGPRRP